MEPEILEQIGLTPGESRVYLALLGLGLSTVSPISKEANVSISKIYEVLEGLIRKGLVSSIVKNNVKHFHATNPERIIDYLEEKKKDIEQDERKIKEYLPQLILKQSLAQKQVVAEVYEGVKGIKTFFENILKELKEDEILYALGIPKEVSEKYSGYFLDWHKRRIKKKIYSKGIFNSDAKISGEKRAKLKFTEIKYLPANITTPAWLEIYKDVVATIHMLEKPICVVIRDKNIAKSYLAYFDLLWKIAKK